MLVISYKMEQQEPQPQQLCGFWTYFSEFVPIFGIEDSGPEAALFWPGTAAQGQRQADAGRFPAP